MMRVAIRGTSLSLRFLSGSRRALARARRAALSARAAPKLSKVPFVNWLGSVFPTEKLPVCSLYLEPGVHDLEYLNTDKDTGCIMDGPQRTMMHDMIGFDVETATEMVLENARSGDTGRSKGVFATARGSGGGKSRILEEIRRNLLRRDKVLPVAITFNFNSEIERDSWFKDVKNLGKAYALSLTVRVASVVFGVSYFSMSKLVQANLDCLDLSSTAVDEMIQEMVIFFVRRVNEGRAALGGPRTPGAVTPMVDTFVLLLDENRKVDAFADEVDMGGYVRTALMNSKLPGVNIGVVISDLGFLPEQLRTGADREVVLFVPPPRLSPERVLELWWKVGGLTAEQKALLLTLIAVYNNTPRGLEYAAEYLHLPKNINRRVNKELVSDLMDHMLVKASIRYAPLFPPTDILKAAFFREKVPVDASLFRAFQDSVITNPLANRSKNAKIIPDVSLLLLRVACDSADSIDDTLARIIEQGIDSVQGAMLGTVDRPPRPGDALEEALTQVLRIRLALAIETGSKSLTLLRLCGLQLEEGYSDDTATALQSPLKLTRTSVASVCAREVVKLGASSYDFSGVAFLAELDAIEVSADRPIRILRSARGDSWDVCVKAHNPDTGRPFHIFFDCKSGAEFVPGRNNSTVEELLRERQQYINTATVLSSGTAGGPPRDHVYIYCITHDGIPEGTLPPHKGEAGGLVVNGRDLLPHHCAIMARDRTLELLGPFAELYRAVRSSLSHKLAVE